MKVHELMELLSSMDANATVMMATQPNRPVQVNVANVVAASELFGDNEDDFEEWQYGGNVVWLTEGHQPVETPYAPRAVFDV